MSFKWTENIGSRVASYALMALQVIVLIGIATIMVTSFGLVGAYTAASMVVMFLLGLPLLILHYFSAPDKDLRTAFMGLTVTIAFLSLAGIVWFLIPGIFDAWWLVPAGKAIMAAAYLPLVLALYSVYWPGRHQLDRGVRLFILSVNTGFIICAALIALMRLPAGNPLDITIYLIAIVADITIMSLSALLAFIKSSMRLRYIYSIIFIFMLSSFYGDLFNLVQALRILPYDIGSYAGYFYDFMLIFLVTGLLVYSFFKGDGGEAVEEANKKLWDTRHAMYDLLSQMPDAACLFSPKGDAVLVNEPYLKLFGVERKDIIGKHNIFRHADGLACGLKTGLEQLKNGKTVYMDSKKIFLKGRELYISFKIFPTFSMEGMISGYVAVCEDVTSRVRSEVELLQAKSMAELYIDLMGHDINNMNQVGMGYLEIAMDTLPVTGEQKSLLAKPLEAMTNSSRLIDNVKKLRRANREDMCIRAMDLGKVLDEVIVGHGQAPGRDILIQNDIGAGTYVMANELLKDVFANLLGNAIKHSEGPVRVGIRHEAVEMDGKKCYRISIEDNGPGIPDEIKPLVFDRLLRGRSRTGGSGIGLYLVKTLIDSYAGRISVEDRVPGDRKQGTRFIVVLPAAS